MEIDPSTEYLPAKNKLKAAFTAAKKTASYRIWRNKLNKCGIYRQTRVKILDVGCGAGYLSRSLEAWYPRGLIFSGDADLSLLRFTKGRSNRASPIQFDAHRLPYSDGCFDLVVSLQVIEHLREPDLFIAETARVLRSRGLLIIATPNPAGIAARLLKDGWQGHKKDHVSLRTPNEWKYSLVKAGFRILEDGTTGLSGLRVFRGFPFGPLNWCLLYLFGFFRWEHGESYAALALYKG